MPAELKIPEDQRFAFNRIMRRMPDGIREDEAIQRKMLLYLKVGGEKLAIAGLRAIVTPFTEKFVLKKVQSIDEDNNLVSAGQGNGEEESEEKKDENPDQAEKPEDGDSTV